MKLLNLIQGSDEWLEARLKYLCASEAPAMMGDSKFMSRNQLLALKKGWQTNPVGDFKQRLFDKGHENEDAARELNEFDLCEEIPPAVGFVVIEGLELLSSYDGLGSFSYIWEHKDWNEVLAENVRNSVLEPHYYWQLEHQMLTAGVNEVEFMVSDGTMDKRVSMTYRSIPDRRQELIAGWKQFISDLNVYELEARAETVIAVEAEALPVFQYEVNGSLISSNIKDCLPIIVDRAQNEMSRVLETEQDFANKDKFNKATKAARAKLKEIVFAVQSEFVTYSEFADTAKQIDSILQKMQSQGEKQVKQQKEAKKLSIITRGEAEILAYVTSCNNAISANFGIAQVASINPDFQGAMKNKRTIDSWQNAADEEVARVKIDIKKVMDVVLPNLEHLNEAASAHLFLFNDIQNIANQGQEAFQAVVKYRIASHEEAEAERREQEREKIRKQEEARILEEQKVAAQAEQQPTPAAIPDQPQQTVEPRFQVPTGRKQEAGPELLRPTETIPITPEEYQSLKYDSALLSALMAAGVDSWDGYAEAMNIVKAA